VIKKQKTDRKDAQLLLKLMREDNFPRIWVQCPENRDLRQLLWHRHQLVPNAELLASLPGLVLPISLIILEVNNSEGLFWRTSVHWEFLHL
jgi:hypothetical protein